MYFRRRLWHLLIFFAVWHKYSQVESLLQGKLMEKLMDKVIQ